MENIRITLETLYDSLRNEKKREDLQELDESFFQDVVNYLKEKTADEKSKEGNELFAAGEQEKLAYELRSIRRILKEIYDKREKKIITIALNKSRTGSNLIDTSTMLIEEKAFYQQLVALLDKFRKGVLLRLFQGELPEILEEARIERPLLSEKTIETKPEEEKQEESEETEEPAKEESTEETNSEPVTEQTKEKKTEQEEPESAEKPTEETSEENTVEEQKEEINQETNEEKTELTKLRFLHPTPSFVWKDMKVYGPFEEGDETEIFPEVAELLVRKGRAEKA